MSNPEGWKEKIADRTLLLRWALKRRWHWFFGKDVFKIQIGDYKIIKESINKESKRHIKALFLFQIAASCFAYRYEPLNKISLIYIDPIPSSSDPLGQQRTVGWKADVLVHTKDTWNRYMEGLIKEKIVFLEKPEAI